MNPNPVMCDSKLSFAEKVRCGVKALICFVVIGVLTSVPGEVLNQILSHENVRAFWSTMLSYVVLLCIGYFVGKGLRRVFRERSKAVLANYLLFGGLGLMVEWFLLENGPKLWPFDPFQLIAHPGMFTFWATMLVTPWLMSEPAEFAGLKKAFLRYFVALSAIYVGVGWVVPREKGGIFFGLVIFAAGYTGLNYYYWKYFKELRRRENLLPAQ